MDKKIEKYNEFKDQFTMAQLEKFSNQIFLNDEKVVKSDGTKIPEGIFFINVDINLNNRLSRILSPQYPMEFQFRGKTVFSIESVLQAMKHKDVDEQIEILNKYENCQKHNEPEPIKNGNLYWNGKTFEPNTPEYGHILDELFISATENPSFSSALRAVGNRYLIVLDENNTNMLPRSVMERRLNSLKGYVQKEYTKAQRSESVKSL